MGFRRNFLGQDTSEISPSNDKRGHARTMNSNRDMTAKMLKSYKTPINKSSTTTKTYCGRGKNIAQVSIQGREKAQVDIFRKWIVKYDNST